MCGAKVDKKSEKIGGRVQYKMMRMKNLKKNEFSKHLENHTVVYTLSFIPLNFLSNHIVRLGLA